jgi:hypothetical protein
MGELHWNVALPRPQERIGLRPALWAGSSGSFDKPLTTKVAKSAATKFLATKARRSRRAVDRSFVSSWPS